MQTQTFIKDMTRMNASKQLQKEKCPAFCHKSKLRLHQHSTSDTLFRQCHYLATAIYRALCGLRSNPKVSLKQVFASVKVNFNTRIRTYPWNISSLTQYLREVPPSIWNHRHNSFHCWVTISMSLHKSLLLLLLLVCLNLHLKNKTLCKEDGRPELSSLMTSKGPKHNFSRVLKQ